MSAIPFFTIAWQDDAVVMLDQRLLPHEEVYQTYTTVEGVAEAIRTMVIRGAPAIGIAGAMGVALGASRSAAKEYAGFREAIGQICTQLAATRPTAVNLFWGLERMKRVCDAHAGLPIPELKQRLQDEACRILEDDIAANRAMGAHGAPLIDDGDVILTHCNAGALATGGHGTALGVLYSTWAAGKRFQVIADETRPVLQGARLTVWELQKMGIPVTLITDSMAGALMAQGRIHKVIVGADRIAANGDVANKIGTYSVAVLAHHHRIPFYVAAPTSTIDVNTPHGNKIPIEERDAKEVTQVLGKKVSLATEVSNPAFDVTPAGLVTALITEKGVFSSPYQFS